MPGHFGTASTAFRNQDNVGSPDDWHFGALSHSLRPRCLRFAGRVTPPPRKTRYRLLARLCRAGLDTRKVPLRGFLWWPSCHHFLLFQAWPGAT